MKKYLIPIICTAVLFTTACEDKLLEPQKGVVAYEDFYQTDDDAEAALAAAYDIMARQLARANGESIISPFEALFNLPGDDVYAAGEFYGDNDFNGQINEFRGDANAQLVTSMYKGFYQIVYGANLVIDNFKDGTTQVQKRCVAEARVMRAWAHMMLAIGWNCPPLIDHVLEGSVRPTNYGNNDYASHKELLKWCGDEAMAAIDDLKARINKNDKKGTTFITKGFARYVAGKAYIFAEDNAAAKTALMPLVTDTCYSLVPSGRIRETFHLAGEGNEEIIYATNVTQNPAMSTWGGKIQKGYWMHLDIWGWRTDHWGGTPSSVPGGWGGLGVRQDFVDDLIANDGANSARRLAWVRKYDPEILYDMAYSTDAPDWANPASPQYDPTRGLYIKSIAVRLDANNDTVWKDPVNKKAEMDTIFTNNKDEDIRRGITSYLYGQSEYLQYKRVLDVADNDNPRTLNVLVARLAEAYLLYAEACARTNDNDGLVYLNRIQNRAGSNTVSGTLTLAAVKSEKRFEMFMEGCRFADLVRWYFQDNDDEVYEKLKDNGKNVPQLYDQLFQSTDPKTGVSNQPRTTKTNTHTIYLVMQHPNLGEVGFKHNKHEFFPFPGAAVMAINPNMIQNPGY
ncbi:MAG: RagB/SusD family nutrient uptake outer membrane protein [Bacteroidaceae bacterium]|nr:RagB/SusD family nutrient uptake outer membrane protein [Bacteroidaceae bacterium]